MGRSARIWLYLGAVALLSMVLSGCGGSSSPTAVSSINPGIFYSHSVAFRNHTTMAWGYNGFGQLGNNSIDNQNVPVPVAGVSGLTGVVAGGTHTLAFKNMSGVWAWGNNGYGQLADGTNIARTTPVQVKTSAAGNPLLTGVTAVAAGGNHSLALKSDGTVWAWGYNGFGQLGDNTGVNRSTAVQVVSDPIVGSPLPKIKAIAAGGAHSLALDVNNQVWAWGYNGYGQLGDGTTINRAGAVPVHVLTDIVAIAAGGSHSLAVKTDGTVWAWGYNEFGQVGTPPPPTTDTTTPHYFSIPQVVATFPAGVVLTQVSAGLDHSLALDSNHNVWGWGYNGYGQLGSTTPTLNKNVPDATPVSTPAQAQTSGISGVITQIIAIGHHTLAITDTNKVWAWGDNLYGQLGNQLNGTANTTNTPVLVTGF